MDIVYCKKWWLSRKKPVNMMSEDSARQRHENRKPYVALLGAADEPRFIVDVAGEWVSVDFLDSRQRKYLSYDFKEVQPGKLFLKGAYFWDYEGDSGTECSSAVFNFDEEGRMVVGEEDSTTSDVKEFESTASVDENWEEYPAFGDYASLCVEERSIA